MRSRSRGEEEMTNPNKEMEGEDGREEKWRRRRSRFSYLGFGC